MPLKAAVFSMGRRKDAVTWKNGCRNLGYDVPNAIRESNPSIEKAKLFFKMKSQWIYFGGHSGGDDISNEKVDSTVRFSETSVELDFKDESIVTLNKGTADFQMDYDCQVILWGGCSGCTHRESVEMLRILFGSPVILGTAGTNGWELMDAMLGNAFFSGKKRDFFHRVKSDPANLTLVVDSWMKAALWGYGKKPSMAKKLRAIDHEGREFKIVNNKIVKGRKFD